MPFIRIQCTQTLTADRENTLVQAVAEATVQSISATLDRTVVTLSYLPEAKVFLAGQLDRPLVWIEAHIKEGRTLAQKQAMLEAVTQVVSSVTGLDKSCLRMFIADMPDGTFC